MTPGGVSWIVWTVLIYICVDGKIWHADGDNLQSEEITNVTASCWRDWQVKRQTGRHLSVGLIMRKTVRSDICYIVVPRQGYQKERLIVFSVLISGLQQTRWEIIQPAKQKTKLVIYRTQSKTTLNRSKSNQRQSVSPTRLRPKLTCKLPPRNSLLEKWRGGGGVPLGSPGSTKNKIWFIDMFCCGQCWGCRPVVCSR